jgi:hypothetical protein
VTLEKVLEQLGLDTVAREIKLLQGRAGLA